MPRNQAQLYRQTQELAVLARVAELLTSLDLDDVLSNTLHLLTETVDAERGSFFLLDDEGRTTQRFITRRNLPPEHSYKVVGRVLEEGLAGWVYRHQQATIVHDTQHDERWVIFPDDESPMRSALCVPFVIDGRINGIMTLEHADKNHFTEGDLRLATTVAHQATVAIRNAQLFDQVETHQRQLQAVLQSIAEPLITISAQGRIQSINPAALALVGATEDAVIGRSPSELSSFPIFAQVATQMSAGRQRFEVRDEVSQRDYAAQVSDWRESEKSALGQVIVFNDITAIQDLNRLKSQMIQMASHDLKNPLGVVLGYAEMLLMDTDPQDDVHSYAEGIARTTERMLDMVTDLLDLERIEASLEGVQEDFSPLPMLDAIISEESVKATQKRQTLQRDLAPNLPVLRGDPSQLREAFRNLLDNAIKYTPEGGTIIVRAATDSRRFNFAVEDTGYGIPAPLQGDLFKRFYRAKQPGTEDIPGTGLGLSLVKAVIERHGGQVWFRSAAGEGSTFGFWLPLPEDQS